MWRCNKCQRIIEAWCGGSGSQTIDGTSYPYDKNLCNTNDSFAFLNNRKNFVSYCRDCEYHLKFYQSRI